MHFLLFALALYFAPAIIAAARNTHLIDRVGYGTVVIHIERGYGHRQPFCRDDLPSSPPPSKFRIVAITSWPPRASVTAVANPMPLLVPVTNAMATFASLGLYGDVKNSSR